MKVTVFGSGYVGLTQATCLSEVGHQVCCVDIDALRVDQLNSGLSPLFEQNLEPLLRKNLAANRLRFTTDAKVAVDFSDLIFIAVGTPPLQDGSADMSQLFSVVDSIAKHAQSAKTLVNKSTSPVGTVARIEAHLRAIGGNEAKVSFRVASNPEFLKEGSAVADCMRPERIIVGTDDEEVVALLRTLYKPFSRSREKFIVMDSRSAELSKYAANCMLATKISFINEMALLAEHLGADIEMVRKGIGSDPRIGYDFIYPGCGFGGSCFPKDISALRKAADDMGSPTPLMKAVEDINAAQKHRLFEKIDRHYNGRLSGKNFALWGLAFKPNTDDMREAPSQVLLRELWQAGANVVAYDPQAMKEARHIFGYDLVLADSKEQALHGADALIVVTEWQDFRVLDLELLRHHLTDLVVFDGRNLYEPEALAQAGFCYYAIGRGLHQQVHP
ncbi:UDP-glucose dehydrogenase family protein [Pseudomonas turukhanskensis]|uniref:UDP-glucose 6-dehydrogenase n=1 Tax=Pseudomonas turukhanskensis TaxID=1806536 RepID=A0A9W6K8C3_9PSED|nr:UDP-glucose/GDP-mannose dehydrogenase family protein [Pseudomonas turukhanskensis]GLK90772.1 UDP-glucose 6-dehydrogenase [Pseudomonas turukhanskensis]